MKLSITDKFLWDTYKFLEKAGNVIDFALSSPYRQMWLIGNDNPMIGKYQRDIGRKEFSKLIYYLKRKSYIKAKNLKGRKAFIITKVGISKALRVSFMIGNNQKRKDGKWIMLMFDIPQSHKKARILMRSILHNLGYKLFQHSVWVSPYDISEKTEELLQMYSLDDYVKVFLIEEIK